jgi:hypothetical protein
LTVEQVQEAERPLETKFATARKPPVVTPVPDDERLITKEHSRKINELITGEMGFGWTWLLHRYGVERAGQLTVRQFDEIVAGINKLQQEYEREAAAAEEKEEEPMVVETV